ncbi:unnamed protein product [Penicillium egyptiacum]|uniref:Uncharacterized protein n=1 Tax=Penicillium egyptiacum TaxID=1303716 RepID=A0A9W4KLF5_9EURO|nr:unnamed protein product [Penicillium egyptiacum]
MTNTVYIWCLCRPPERHLSYGHSICDIYAASFSLPLPKSDTQIRLDYLFNNSGELLVNIKPPTAGVRLIGINSGGARGVTPLEFLGELQKLLRECPIHDIIDLTLGTSLAKFHQKWPVSYYASVFETLTRRCFSTSSSALGRLKAVVKYITSDAIYDERFLEGAL